jgi:hypothetical protein
LREIQPRGDVQVIDALRDRPADASGSASPKRRRCEDGVPRELRIAQRRRDRVPFIRKLLELPTELIDRGR